MQMIACSCLEILCYLGNTSKTYARFCTAESYEERKNKKMGYLVYIKDKSCSSYSPILDDGVGESHTHDRNFSCPCLNFLHGNQGTKRVMVDDSVLF